MNNHETPPSRAALLLAFAAIYLVWGSTYLAIRVGVETLPPFLMAGLRFFMAGVPLFLWLRWRGAARPTRVQWLSAIAVGSLMLAGGNGLVTWAEQTVPSGIAAVIIATVPLWMTTLDAWPFRRSRLSAAKLVGLACGLFGVALIAAPDPSDVHTLAAWPVLALVVAALSWSIGSLVSRSLPLPRSPFLSAAMQMIGGGTVLLLWGSVAGEWSRLDPSAVSFRSAAALAYLITFGSIVALCAYVWLMRVASAAAVSSYAFVNPLVAVALGWAVLGETLSQRTMLATGLVVGGVLFLHGTRFLSLGKASKAPRIAPEPATAEEIVASCNRARLPAFPRADA